MSNSVRFQQTEIIQDKSEDLTNSLGSIEYALDYLLDNFVIVHKKEFHGISGYLCKKCLTFEYRYIKNIWEEEIAKDKHVHDFNMSSGINRPAKERGDPNTGK